MAERRDLRMGQDHNFVILEELYWKNWEEGGIGQGRSGVEISKGDSTGEMSKNDKRFHIGRAGLAPCS